MAIRMKFLPSSDAAETGFLNNREHPDHPYKVTSGREKIGGGLLASRITSWDPVILDHVPAFVRLFL